MGIGNIFGGNSVVDTFRNMYNEVVEKKTTGKSFDRMKKALNRMEQLESEVGSGPRLTTLLTNEDLFTEFSTAYSEVLAEIAHEEYNGAHGDEKLFQNTLEAYEKSINELEGKPNADKLIAPIKEMIELGKSGISYPVFLRLCEEKGMNKALEGNIVVRESILEDIKFAQSMYLLLEVEKNQKILKVFDDIASKSKFGVPDSFEFGLEREKIEWEYAPMIKKWNRAIHIWSKMIECLVDWVDSYCSFAPTDYRWADRRGMIHTMKNIKRSQECNPGIFRAREKIFQEYFQLGWNEIFTHPTFLNEKEANRIEYSDETIDLIKNAYPYCKPFNKPDPEIIKEAERIHSKII